MNQERFDRIRLARSEGIGSVGFRRLLARFGSAGDALRALPDLARRGGRAPVLADLDRIAREVNRASALGAVWLIQGDREYPALLAQIPDAPPVLMAMGDVSLARRRCVAMVGARNASAAACRFARMVARDLAAQEVAVVSGLARGIDTAAHRGALGEAGERAAGPTIGVIASGIDIAYPPENAALQERIATEGLLLAEQPLGAEPRARNFPHRNRVIAGLSLATLVVEAAPKSGSLITARLAGDYGRDVLAVPGSPLDPRAQGCNLLIRDGAVLIQSAADVIEAISPVDDRSPRLPFGEDLVSPPQIVAEPEERERNLVIRLLGAAPVSVDEVIRQSGLDPAMVRAVLLDLELAGRLERQPGGWVALL
ncbi:MAG: DNA-protecting protein DprA [Sphingomonadales bacterium]|nr:MAG: DNA-protecting protein DprA [Sphingomonadales bacterium]